MIARPRSRLPRPCTSGSGGCANPATTPGCSRPARSPGLEPWLSSRPCVCTLGWESVPLNDTLCVATGVLALCLLVVTAYAAVSQMIRSRKTPPGSGVNLTAQMTVLMVVVSAALIVSYLVFNGTVAYQPQARYL